MAITWRNVAGPDFGSTVQAQKLGAETLGRGLTQLQTQAQGLSDASDPNSAVNVAAKARQQQMEQAAYADKLKGFNSSVAGLVGSDLQGIDQASNIFGMGTDAGINLADIVAGQTNLQAAQQNAGLNTATTNQTAVNEQINNQLAEDNKQIDNYVSSQQTANNNRLLFNPEVDATSKDNSIKVTDVVGGLNRDGRSDDGTRMLTEVEKVFKKNGINRSPTGAELKAIFDTTGFDDWSAWVSWFTSNNVSLDDGDLRAQAEKYAKQLDINESSRVERDDFNANLKKRADAARQAVKKPGIEALTQQWKNRVAQFNNRPYEPVVFGGAEVTRGVLEQLRNSGEEGALRARQYEDDAKNAGVTIEKGDGTAAQDKTVVAKLIHQESVGDTSATPTANPANGTTPAGTAAPGTPGASPAPAFTTTNMERLEAARQAQLAAAGPQEPYTPPPPAPNSIGAFKRDVGPLGTAIADGAGGFVNKLNNLGSFLGGGAFDFVDGTAAPAYRDFAAKANEDARLNKIPRDQRPGQTTSVERLVDKASDKVAKVFSTNTLEEANAARPKGRGRLNLSEDSLVSRSLNTKAYNLDNSKPVPRQLASTTDLDSQNDVPDTTPPSPVENKVTNFMSGDSSTLSLSDKDQKTWVDVATPDIVIPTAKKIKDAKPTDKRVDLLLKAAKKADVDILQLWEANKHLLKNNAFSKAYYDRRLRR